MEEILQNDDIVLNMSEGEKNIPYDFNNSNREMVFNIKLGYHLRFSSINEPNQLKL